MKARQSSAMTCPCGSSSYQACCGRYIDGHATASNALELMRSRYSAFVLRNETYLRATWHPDTLPSEPVTGETDVRWVGLQIIKHIHADQADEATVEFVARFKIGGRAHRLHEISYFVRSAFPASAPGQKQDSPNWYYVSGIFPEET